jgi:hypothetical protein
VPVVVALRRQLVQGILWERQQQQQQRQQHMQQSISCR